MPGIDFFFILLTEYEKAVFFKTTLISRKQGLKTYENVFVKVYLSDGHLGLTKVNLTFPKLLSPQI